MNPGEGSAVEAADDEESTKHCPKCDNDLPRAAFGPSKRTKDGLFGWCRGCKRAGDMRSHTAHRPERTRKMRDRYHADPEPQRAASRARAAADPEANRARAAAWNRANGNGGRRTLIHRASDQRRRAADPDYFREKWRRRNALIRKGVETLPFTLDQLAAKLDYWGGRCRWCGGEAECWDHVKPLAAGGPHMLANLCPACVRCNSAKRDDWPLSKWLLRLARLLIAA